MPKKRFSAEQIVVLLRQIEVLMSQGKAPPIACREAWQFMRDNWLSNRIFRSYENLVDHCCHAWNKLVDQPWKIMSIGLRDWAHEF